MKIKFSDNDILRFLYEEMSEDESKLFLDALTQDENLWERYEHFQQTTDQVSFLSFEPSEASLSAIMDVVEQEGTGKSKKKFSLRRLSTSPYSMGLVAASFLTLFLFARLGTNIQSASSQEVTLEYEALPAPTLVHEVRMETEEKSDFSWNAQDLDQKLDQIKQKAQSLSDDPLL